jgi:hypothetical protein
MFTRKVGPIWAPGEEGNQGAGAEGAGIGAAGGAAAETGTQNAGDGGAGDSSGSADAGAGTAFAALDEDTRGWLQTKGLGDVQSLAKSARESEKLLGGMVKLPGKDATPEEREAFLNKLGRPEKVDGYQFTPPKDMPEGLPYDGDRAKAFAGVAHKLGITQEQAAGLHDWFMADSVNAFASMGEAQKAAMQQRGVAETEKLVKEWGPLEGDTARANFEIADKVFTQVPGGQDFLQELQALNLVGPNKEILSAPIAKMLASLGTALYTEDGVLRGKPDVIGNPFDKKAPSFNLTEAMKIAKEDPDRARSYLTAAGGKPEEFGLKAV